MKVINLLGEPSVGKSITASGVHSKLGRQGYSVELVPEVAKNFAWESFKVKNKIYKHPIFKQPTYLFASQNRSLQRIRGKVDYAITDSPLILSAVYKEKGYFKEFSKLVLKQFKKYDNINILLKRKHKYIENGRVHKEKEAIKIRKKLIKFLNKHNIKYKEFTTSKNIISKIVKYIKKQKN